MKFFTNNSRSTGIFSIDQNGPYAFIFFLLNSNIVIETMERLVQDHLGCLRMPCFKCKLNAIKLDPSYASLKKPRFNVIIMKTPVRDDVTIKKVLISTEVKKHIIQNFHAHARSQI